MLLNIGVSYKLCRLMGHGFRHFEGLSHSNQSVDCSAFTDCITL